MLLPLSHENMVVRRMPVVTLVLIAVTVLLHAVASIAARPIGERVLVAAVNAQEMYVARPELGVCTPLKMFPLAVAAPAPALSDDAVPRDVADRYEAACDQLAAAVASLPSERFGYVPARPRLTALVTYMFVHADWMHVIGNVWFLFLCGLALEDRWGRVAFGAYYVVSGIVAAGVHHLLDPASTAALIGASGAVAGLMGAFVVLFARTKIRFVALLGFRPVSFEAPAYVMLPLWAVVELLFGGVATSTGIGSGTAHWAHVGGFVFGAAVAGVARAVGVDARLDDAAEKAAVLGDDPRLEAAKVLIARGEAEQAVAMLEGLLVEKPESTHARDALVEARKAVAAVHRGAEAPAVKPAVEAKAAPYFPGVPPKE